MVTPVGEKGAMGNSVLSNDLFISPLPVYSSLLLHYDASWINRTNTAEFENNRVKRWYDIGPFRHASATPASNINNQPGLMYYVYGHDTQKHTYGVKSETSGTQTLTSNLGSSISRQNVTLYLALNFDDENGAADNIVLLSSKSGGSNQNKFVLKTSSITDFEGQLELVRYNDAGTSFSVINQSDYRTKKWEIIKLEVYSSQLAIKSILTENDATYSFAESYTSSSTSDNITLMPFTMSFANGYAIGEVLIYDGMTSNTDEQLILKYLHDKYRP